MLQCAQRLPGMPGRSPVSSGESPTRAVCFLKQQKNVSLAFEGGLQWKIERLRSALLSARPKPEVFREKRWARVAPAGAHGDVAREGRGLRAFARRERPRTRGRRAEEWIGGRTHRRHVRNARASRLLDSCASPTATLVLVTEKPSGRACSARASERRRSLSGTGAARWDASRKRVAAGQSGLVSRFRAREDQPRRIDQVSCPSSSGNCRARVRTSRPDLARRVPVRFDSPRTFWWLNRQWGKTGG